MKNGVKLMSALNTPFNFNESHNVYYNKDSDALLCGGMTLYIQGKFAEIIPSKKPLPKTKEEMLDFLRNFEYLYHKDNSKIEDFLNDYED